MDRYRIEIEKALDKVSDKGKLLFAVLTSEKLYPNYVFFHDKTNWGNIEVLREGIIFLYHVILTNNELDRGDIRDLIVRIDEITPDTEDFVGIEVSFALDACNAVYSSLCYLLDSNIQHIIDVATYARDTVDMFVQEKYDLDMSKGESEEVISNDPFMVREKKRQMKVLQKIGDLNLTDITNQTIEYLRDKTPIIDTYLL